MLPSAPEDQPAVRNPILMDYRCGVRLLDIDTIGAGGGSIARVDAGGGLRVGPESAGADPGPACYGKRWAIRGLPLVMPMQY